MKIDSLLSARKLFLEYLEGYFKDEKTESDITNLACTISHDLFSPIEIIGFDREFDTALDNATEFEYESQNKNDKQANKDYIWNKNFLKEYLQKNKHFIQNE